MNRISLVILLAGLLGLCGCKTEPSHSSNPYAALIEVGPDSAWTQLQNEVKVTKSVGPYPLVGGPFRPDYWIDTSLEIYGWSQKLELKDLVKLWREIESKQVASAFTQSEISALIKATARLNDFAKHPNIKEGHRLLLVSDSEYQDTELTEHPEDRDAQFRLLHAIFVRASLNTPKDKSPWNPEWLYLQGRALQAINEGGKEELRDFILETKGRSPYARPALDALTQILRDEMDPRDSPEKLQPPADLLEMVEKN